MDALTFVYIPKWDRYLGYEPNGEFVGYVRRSRFKYDIGTKCARTWEAVLRGQVGAPHPNKGHCGYAGEPEIAMRLLLSGADFHIRNRL